MRIRRQLALVMAMALLAVAVSAVAAGAGVERYQFKTYVLNVETVNGVSGYWHTLTISLDNPCDDTYSGSGVRSAGTETLRDFDMTGITLSAASDYDNANYTWFPSFDLNSDGTLTFVDDYNLVLGEPDDNVWGATGTWTMSQTNYNHGEYVAESVEDYGSPDAHSCIGMPMVSNKTK